MAAIEFSFSRLNHNIVSIPAHSTGTIDPISQGSRFIHRPGVTRPYNSGPNSQSHSHGEINNMNDRLIVCNQPGGTAVMNESLMQNACDGLLPWTVSLHFRGRTKWIYIYVAARSSHDKTIKIQMMVTFSQNEEAT